MATIKKQFLALSLSFVNLCFGANLAELERACNARNSNACVSLADRYFNAQGVAKDYKKAQHYLTKACDLDNAEGCRKLGVVYQLNHDRSQESYSRIKKSYGKACILSKHQNPCDEYRLIAKFDTHIYEIDKQICALNDFSPAFRGLVCFHIGYNYEKQQNNLNQAKIYYKKACDLAHKDACAFLAFAYVSQNNPSEAKFYFEKACNLTHNIACSSLATMYKIGEGVEQDIQKAKFYYQKSCELGYKNACEKLKEFQ